MVQPTTARLMQATRARFFRPGMNNQWGYVRHLHVRGQELRVQDVLNALADNIGLQIRHERKPSSLLPKIATET